MTVKITTLTYSNIDALHVAEQHDLFAPHELTIGKTIAVFNCEPAVALGRVNLAISELSLKFGRRGHPVQSLQAVRRKLERAVDAAPKITAAPEIVIKSD